MHISQKFVIFFEFLACFPPWKAFLARILIFIKVLRLGCKSSIKKNLCITYYLNMLYLCNKPQTTFFVNQFSGALWKKTDQTKATPGERQFLHLYLNNAAYLPPNGHKQSGVSCLLKPGKTVNVCCCNHRCDSVRLVLSEPCPSGTFVLM